MARPEDIVGGILDCYHDFRHCIIRAVVITDEQARLKAALQCLVDLDDCKSKAVPPEASLEIGQIQKRLRALEGRKKK